MSSTFEKIYLECPVSSLSDLPTLPTPDNCELRYEANPTYLTYRDWHDTVGRPYGWHTRPRIQDEAGITELLKTPSTRFYLLIVSGQPVGYALLVEEEPNDVEISDFGFLPADTGKGYGKQCMTLLLADIASRNPDRVWLSTRSTNDTRVVDFYQQCGFAITKRETHSA